MLLTKIVFEFVIVCILLYALNAAKHQTIKLERIKCTAMGCTGFGCKIHRSTPRTQVLNGYCNLTKPVKNVYVHAQMFYRYNRYMPFLYNMHMDVCDHLGNQTKFQPFMQLAQGFLEKYTENLVNQTCPVFGNITVNDLDYSVSMLQNTIVPIGQFRVDMRLYEMERPNFTIFEAKAYLSSMY